MQKQEAVGTFSPILLQFKGTTALRSFAVLTAAFGLLDF